MRHRKRTGKLGRTSAHRKALLRNMVTSLLDHERIETTHAKAREVRRTAERMITLGKRGGLHARRRALRMIRSREVAAKVFDDLAERYRDRSGGYTRVLKLGTRVGDAAPVSVVELVEGAAGGRAPAASTAAKRPRGGAKPSEGRPSRGKSAKRTRSEPKAGPGKKAVKAKAEEKPRARRKAKAKSEKAEKAEKPVKRRSAGSAKATKKKKVVKTAKAARKKTSRKKSD